MKTKNPMIPSIGPINRSVNGFAPELFGVTGKAKNRIAPKTIKMTPAATMPPRICMS
jgi:hypothetical protein